jgi:hypothetical protein
MEKAAYLIGEAIRRNRQRILHRLGRGGRPGLLS